VAASTCAAHGRVRAPRRAAMWREIHQGAPIWNLLLTGDEMQQQKIKVLKLEHTKEMILGKLILDHNAYVDSHTKSLET
jgi:hypothetical protein